MSNGLLKLRLWLPGISAICENVRKASSWGRDVLFSNRELSWSVKRKRHGWSLRVTALTQDKCVWVAPLAFCTACTCGEHLSGAHHLWGRRWQWQRKTFVFVYSYDGLVGMPIDRNLLPFMMKLSSDSRDLLFLPANLYHLTVLSPRIFTHRLF